MRPRPSDLKVGMSYLGVLCRRCGEHIPMVQDDPLATKTVDVATKDEPIIVFCPFCGLSARYRNDELTSRTFTKILPPLQ
jgi:RNase P subunit RPR2